MQRNSREIIFENKDLESSSGSYLLSLPEELFKFISQCLGLRDHPTLKLLCRTIHAYTDHQAEMLLHWHFPDRYAEIQEQIKESAEHKNEDPMQARFLGEFDLSQPINYDGLLKEAYQAEYVKVAPRNIKMLTLFKEGNLQCIQEEMREQNLRGEEINVIFDGHHQTVAAWAYRNGRLSVLNYLYEQAIQEYKTPDGRLDVHKQGAVFKYTVLHMAVYCWQPQETLAALIQQGADANAISNDIVEGNELHALTIAGLIGHLDAVSYFISQRETLDIPVNIIKQATIKHALVGGQILVAKYLFELDVVKAGARDAQLEAEWMGSAIASGSVEMVRYYEKILKSDNRFHGAAHELVRRQLAMMAAGLERVNLLQYFYEVHETADVFEYTCQLFAIAIKYNHLPVVEYLCKHSRANDYVFVIAIQIAIREWCLEALQSICHHLQQCHTEGTHTLLALRLYYILDMIQKNDYQAGARVISATLLTFSQKNRIKPVTRELYALTHRYYEHLTRSLNQHLKRYHKKFPETISIEELRWARCGDEAFEEYENQMRQDKPLLAIIAKLEAVTRLQDQIDPYHHSPSLENIRSFARALERENKNIAYHRRDYFWQRFFLDAVTLLSGIGLILRPLYSYYQTGSFHFWKPEGVRVAEKLGENAQAIEKEEELTFWRGLRMVFSS